MIKKDRLHIHVGPGHHEQILFEQLDLKGISYSSSDYHPKYRFSSNGRNQGSRLYDFVNWFIWGVRNKIRALNKSNWQIDFTYPLYDWITSKRISQGLNLLFCWPQVSLTTMKKAKSNGCIIVLDYPIPHVNTWQKLLEEEMVLNNANFAHSLFSNKMVKRMKKEIELADFISVPSVFVKESFLEWGVPEEKLIFNSYGINSDIFRQNREVRNDRLVLIFVGSVEFRKGVQYLLDAISQIPKGELELRIVGTVHKDFEHIYNRYKDSPNINWLGQRTKTETAELMRTSDAMVMPSILEGLSLTILEALASGIPVISSTNAGGAGIIEDGVNGFLVPIRDVSAIRDRIEWCLKNIEKLDEMGENARKTAISNYTDKEYGKRFMDLVISKFQDEE